MTGTERYRKKKSDKYAEKGRGREIRKGGEKRKSWERRNERKMRMTENGERK